MFGLRIHEKQGYIGDRFLPARTSNDNFQMQYENEQNMLNHF
jgi:hypothetical protein